MAKRSPLTHLFCMIALAILPLTSLAELKTTVVTRANGAGSYSAEAVVEAVRHAELAPQVSGRVMSVPVKAGDRVAAGAVLVEIDARAALDQQAAARAQFDAAQRDYARMKELFAQKYISKTAMDLAEAQYRVARAQAKVAGTQSDYHRIAAPYRGVVADVPVEVGDMAQPGQAVVSFYDPAQLRLTAQVPEAVAAMIATDKIAIAEVANGTETKTIAATAIHVFPTANLRTHTREVRIALPADADVIPGAFARVLLPLRGSESPLTIPVRSVVQRVEFVGVYVIDAQQRVQLRQVRLGRGDGERVEVLAGLREGERIALEPLVALRATQGRKDGANE